MRLFEGSYKGKDLSIALVVSRFNRPICETMLQEAIAGLKSHGVFEENILIAWVPGAFEIPLVAKKLAKSGRYDAVIGMGVVIRGQTAHFDYVAGQAAAGILQTSLETEVPVIFSVLTTETVEQAEKRAASDGKNLGLSGAKAALEMANLLNSLCD